MGGDQSCSVKCGTVGGTVTQLMSYNGMYSLTNMEGNWHQIFALDNSNSGATSSYTEKYTVGYSKTLSRTEVNDWSVGLSAKIEDITISAGYKNTVTKYAGETWSSSVERDLNINVPAHEKVDFEQRTLVSTFQMNSDILVEGFGNKGHAFKFSPEGTNGFAIFDANNKKCGSCHYNTGNVINPILGFNTNCYTTSLDPDSRESWCPSPTKGEETHLLFGAKSHFGLLSIVKVHISGDSCNACSICKEQLDDPSQHALFTDIGSVTNSNALQACLNAIECTNSISATAEPCVLPLESTNGYVDKENSNKSTNVLLIICLIFMIVVSIATSACAFFQYKARVKQKRQEYALMNSGF